MAFISGTYLEHSTGSMQRVYSTSYVDSVYATNYLFFFKDFLAPRLARVAVDGSFSSDFVLQNMVFQGTVSGPSLWNIYFADVHEPAERNGARERRFAYDLTVSKAYPGSITNKEVPSDLHKP